MKYTFLQTVILELIRFNNFVLHTENFIRNWFE